MRTDHVFYTGFSVNIYVHESNMRKQPVVILFEMRSSGSKGQSRIQTKVNTNIAGIRILYRIYYFLNIFQEDRDQNRNPCSCYRRTYPP